MIPFRFPHHGVISFLFVLLRRKVVECDLFHCVAPSTNALQRHLGPGPFQPLLRLVETRVGGAACRANIQCAVPSDAKKATHIRQTHLLRLHLRLEVACVQELLIGLDSGIVDKMEQEEFRSHCSYSLWLLASHCFHRLALRFYWQRFVEHFLLHRLQSLNAPCQSGRRAARTPRLLA